MDMAFPNEMVIKPGTGTDTSKVRKEARSGELPTKFPVPAPLRKGKIQDSRAQILVFQASTWSLTIAAGKSCPHSRQTTRPPAQRPFNSAFPRHTGQRISGSSSGSRACACCWFICCLLTFFPAFGTLTLHCIR